MFVDRFILKNNQTTLFPLFHNLIEQKWDNLKQGLAFTAKRYGARGKISIKIRKSG